MDDNTAEVIMIGLFLAFMAVLVIFG